MLLTEAIHVVSDTSGLIGSIYLAVAFIRRERLRFFRERHLDPVQFEDGSERARSLIHDARSALDQEIERTATVNYRFGIIGTLLLCFAFVAKVAASVIVAALPVINIHIF